MVASPPGCQAYCVPVAPSFCKMINYQSFHESSAAITGVSFFGTFFKRLFKTWESKDMQYYLCWKYTNSFCLNRHKTVSLCHKWKHIVAYRPASRQRQEILNEQQLTYCWKRDFLRSPCRGVVSGTTLPGNDCWRQRRFYVWYSYSDIWSV
jgi:hypothetical protein